MDAAYKRAIADWKPKNQTEDNLVTHVNTKFVVEKAKAENVRLQYFENASAPFDSRQHTKQLHASPLIPNTPLRNRRDSTFLPDPPPYDNDEYGDSSFQHLSLGDYDDLEGVPAQQFVSDTFSTCPAPPPISPRKQVCL